MNVVVKKIGFCGTSGVNERLKEVAEGELKSTSKMLSKDTVYDVKFTKKNRKYGTEFKCETTVTFGGRIIRGCGSAETVELAMKESEKDLRRKVRKLKGKIIDGKYKKINKENKDGAQGNNEEKAVKSSITKTKSFDIECMTYEEAVEQCELLGHSFFIFMNRLGNVCVVYKRDKGYGVIKVNK